MATKNKKQFRRNRIRMRIRKTVVGSAERPRMSVFRSNKSIYVQLIDDQAGHTLLAATSVETTGAEKMSKLDQAKSVGKHIANKAKEAGITTVVFDRGGYLYHGRIKALAEAAREGGLKL
jgi:large subunit ribosomal protein L18